MHAPDDLTAFIHAIPKTDLHVHLDGSLRLSTLIELARAEGVALPSYDEEGLRRTVFKDRYANLPEYLQGFAYTCAVLQRAEPLERAAFELAEDNLAEGVRYVEVRFAPQLHLHEGLSAVQLVSAVARGLEAARRAHNAQPSVQRGDDLPFEFGLILCAMRSFHETMSPYFRQLLQVLSRAPRREVYAAASLELARLAVELRDREGLPVVGFDLAGEESGYPAGYHAAAYRHAHHHFLKKTVHAGEAYGPESIFQALTACHANRLGHGTFLFAHERIKDPQVEDPKRYTEQLAEYVATQRITVEVCLTSNLQTIPEIERLGDHPLRHMLDRNLSVSLCTDNRLVSHTTVSREMELAARHFPMTRHQFRNLALAGFKGSFFPGSYNEKRAYVRRAGQQYDALESALRGPCSPEESMQP